jgi:hypothetical protein
MTNSFKISRASILFLILLLTFFTACDKQHAKKLAGNYDCIVQYKHTDWSNYSIDSIYEEVTESYQENIEVTRNGKYLTVIGEKFYDYRNEIHIDSLWKNDEYIMYHQHTSHQSSLTIKFSDNSLYIKLDEDLWTSEHEYVYEGSKK